MTTDQTCICHLPNSPNWVDHHLQHTAKKEELIIEEYTQVLEAIEEQYLRLGKLLMDTEKGTFQEDALQAVMNHVREMMTTNEASLNKARNALWEKFEQEGGDVYR